MKILVLGNGFDLDHNLPTSYMDFLNFCNYILEMNYKNYGVFPKLKEKQLEYVEILGQDKEMKDKLLSLIKENPILSYFNNVCIKIETLGDNWIDFEKEIKIIVNCFKELELQAKQSNKCSYEIEDPNHIVYELLQYTGISIPSSWTEKSLRSLHKKLCAAFSDFAKAFEYYIATFVNKTTIEGFSPDIVQFNADKVLTFNYSNTYERIYGGVHWRETVDHVHGSAHEKIAEDTGIILGITSMGEESQSSYVEFEKYYQRIVKKTGNKYKEWLQLGLEVNDKIEIMFFGHSLDSSDSDIILDLVCNENSVVSIYYYNEEALHLVVANLINIIGKERLIRYVYGNKPKIQLIPQRKHQMGSTAGIEITRDIRNLYNLHLFSDIEIEKMLSKIEEKIKTRDLSYFYSQKKAISLFEGLKKLGVKFVNRKTFFEICVLLDYEQGKAGKVKLFSAEDWYEQTPWDDDIPCNVETRELINDINISNKKRVKIMEEGKKFANIVKMETSEEIKNALLFIFEEKNPSKEYWKQLEELISSMVESKLLHSAISLINKEDLSIPVYSKVRYFEKRHCEIYYQFQYAKQMEEDRQYEEI